MDEPPTNTYRVVTGFENASTSAAVFATSLTPTQMCGLYNPDDECYARYNDGWARDARASP